MTKRIALFVCLVVSMFAQLPQSSGRDYTVYREVALSASGEAVTIQTPATQGRLARLVGAYVYCSVSCDVTIERDGTAASTTLAVPTPIRATTPAAVTTAYTASNAGVGTVVGKYTILNGGDKVFDLQYMTVLGQGNTHNITVRISSITGSVKILIQFYEV